MTGSILDSLRRSDGHKCCDAVDVMVWKHLNIKIDNTQ